VFVTQVKNGLFLIPICTQNFSNVWRMYSRRNRFSVLCCMTLSWSLKYTCMISVFIFIIGVYAYAGIALIHSYLDFALQIKIWKRVLSWSFIFIGVYICTKRLMLQRFLTLSLQCKTTSFSFRLFCLYLLVSLNIWNRNYKVGLFFLNVWCILVFYVFLCCCVCWFLHGPFCHDALKLDLSV